MRHVTGHCRDDGELGCDWNGLADPETTLVVYMGKATTGRMAERIIAHGLVPKTPVAIVCNGTHARQRYLSTPDAVADTIRDACLEGPVLFIVGRVVNLAGAQLDGEEDAYAIDMADSARVG